jgi:hypothetical protein
MISSPPLVPPNSIGELTQVAGNTLIIDQSDSSWLRSRWWLQLQPGSWRGLSFYTDVALTTAGRRTALHEYPYRDSVWVEDLGRLPRRFSIRGWIVGDDVYQQRDAMMQACEVPGEGTLVHPTFGTVQVVLVEYAMSDRKERGRVVELTFSFVVTGDITFPAASASTRQAVINEAEALILALGVDLSLAIEQLQLDRVPTIATDPLAQFPEAAIAAVNDPARALSAVTGLPDGFYGRYATGRRSAFQPAGTTVDGALANADLTRQAVLTAANNMIAALQAL